MKLHVIKDTVKVSVDSYALNLEYGLSKISIPNSSSYQNVINFVTKRLDIDSIQEFNNDELKLIDLFINQGYLRYKIENELTLRNTKEIFDSIRVKWYNEYYAHPVWQLLREGKLNRNGLLAWIVHNYHVSRSAGMTDARFYSKTSDIKLKEAYMESCLEEYAHCDEFYFVAHPKLEISDEEVRNYIHLPSSLAFDQQMLRMSEDCWLGHVFISYFQEATVNYYDDCLPFYNIVEKNYEIKDFFNRWKEHIELDLKYGHFGHFESIFSEEVTIKKDYFEFALSNAWITYKYLYNALDEIILEANKSQVVLLRNPIKNCTLDSSRSSLLLGYNIDSKVDFKQSKSFLELIELLKIANLIDKKSVKISKSSQQYIHYDVRNLITKSLGYSKSHFCTIILGNILQFNKFEIRENENICISPSLLAISNFLNELTYRPEHFIFALKCLIESKIGNYFYFSDETNNLIDKNLANLQIQYPQIIDELLNIFLQLNELLLKLSNDEVEFNFERELN
jgi:hypothetical protein